MANTSNRILTTHVGSMPRPVELLDAMKAKYSGSGYDAEAYDRHLQSAVTGLVRRQADTGIDIVTDGELSKPGFFTYVRERLTGFEPGPGTGLQKFGAEVNAFPEYYEEYFARAMGGGGVAPTSPMVCTGPVKYQGQEAVKRDIENLKAALSGVECTAAFLPASAPSGVGSNQYYATEEEFYTEAGEALRQEYLAIVDAGLIVQIDDPFMSEHFHDSPLDDAGKAKWADMYIECLNHTLRGIPPENIRFHTCYGINDGPRLYEASLSDVVEHMLKVNASAYSFEAANVRHEHEYHLWEDVKLPDGKTVIPGVITHAGNTVEHPELIAERLIRFADRVGRDNVIAGADCGFSSQACYHTEVHPTVIWAKFDALVEGARIASDKLWS
ncbi:MAG: cobalamin-independent methionine synthase II family protein [Proteobacteria bacterium]|nr:cobalamin-independent methionine synthase II family protein [Pseudomonadota bacterium]